MSETSEQPGQRRGEILAYFVGGPDNGMTRWLPEGTTDWRVMGQRAIQGLTMLADASPTAMVGSMRSHRYRRAMPLTNPYLRGCWVFEWLGES